MENNLGFFTLLSPCLLLRMRIATFWTSIVGCPDSCVTLTTATLSFGGQTRCSPSKIYYYNLKKPTFKLPPSYQQNPPSPSQTLTPLWRPAYRIQQASSQRLSLAILCLGHGSPTFNLNHPHLCLSIRLANSPSHLTHHQMFLSIPKAKGGKQFSRLKLITTPQHSPNNS